MERKSRYVIHSGHFMDESVAATIDDLYEEFAKENQASKGVDMEPIPFLLNSEGGSPFAALALADCITDVQSMGCAVLGRARGQVASAAIFPWLVCSERVASRDCLFMVHGATDHGFGDLVSHEVELAASKTLHRIMSQRLADRTNKDVRHWLRLLKSDKPNYYTAQQALELGLVDAVV